MSHPAADLLAAAQTAAQRAYAPYSNFQVGAAVLDAAGNIHLGCNVENASYGLTVCAERNAIFAAIASGAPRPFVALALVCHSAPPDAPIEASTPCGACRQVIAEHFAPTAIVHIGQTAAFAVADLLPSAFALNPKPESGNS